MGRTTDVDVIIFSQSEDIIRKGTRKRKACRAYQCGSFLGGWTSTMHAGFFCGYSYFR